MVRSVGLNFAHTMVQRLSTKISMLLRKSQAPYSSLTHKSKEFYEKTYALCEG